MRVSRNALLVKFRCDRDEDVIENWYFNNYMAVIIFSQMRVDITCVKNKIIELIIKIS